MSTQAGSQVEATVTLGTTFGGDRCTLGLDDLTKHLLTVGQSGVGKTTLIAALQFLYVDDAPPVDGHQAVPILNVASLAETMRCFSDELGWHRLWDWGDPADFGAVALDRAELFLCQGGQGGPGTWVMCFVDDVDAYAAAIRPRTATVREGPVDRPWGVRELLIELPDGHVIRFGGPVSGT